MFAFEGMYIWHVHFFGSFIILDEGTVNDTITGE